MRPSFFSLKQVSTISSQASVVHLLFDPGQTNHVLVFLQLAVVVVVAVVVF